MRVTPDGHGGYTRSAQSVECEDNVGQAVADGAKVRIRSFTLGLKIHSMALLGHQ